MVSLFKSVPKGLTLREFPLKNYYFNFSLDKLTTGVDNIRHDVFLSPTFCKATGDLTFRLLARQTGTEEILKVDLTSGTKERNAFRETCHDILVDGINKAKTGQEVQIDFLAQIAITKMLIKQIQVQYEVLIRRFKNNLYKNETSRGQHHPSTIRLKEKLNDIQQNKKKIIRSTGHDLFNVVTYVMRSGLKEMREANFGAESILPYDVFTNPMLQAENPSDVYMLIEAYDLIFGFRMEDPDKYSDITNLVRSLLGEIVTQHHGISAIKNISDVAHPEEDMPIEFERELDSFIMHIDNVDMLLNYYKSLDHHKLLKRQKSLKKNLSHKRNWQTFKKSC